MDHQDERSPYWRREQEPEEEPGYAEFRHQYVSFSDRVERFLTQLVILGLVSLALVQTLHTNSTARRMLNLVEGLEGIPWTEVASWNTGEDPRVRPASGVGTQLQVTVVSMTRRSVPEVTLLVDGRAVGTFRAGSVTVPVLPGQTLSVDGRGSPDALSFRIVAPVHLRQPALGTTITTRGDLKSFGRVESEP